MESDKKRADVFVFTSFQGGVGKSSLALSFARQMRLESGRPGVVLELNRFSPSFLAFSSVANGGLKSSLLSFYMSDWASARPEDLHEIFSCEDGLVLLPFSGAHKNEKLEPIFSFGEVDLSPIFDKLRSLFAKNDHFIVVDIPLGLSPVPLYWLHQADFIFYIRTPQYPSERYATRFLKELETRPELKDHIVFIQNMVAQGNVPDANPLFKDEFMVPLALDQNDTGDSQAVDTALKEIARQIMTRPFQGERKKKTVTGIRAQALEVLDEYQKRLRVKIVGGLEKHFGLSDHDLRKMVERSIDEALKTNPPPEIEGIDVREETKRRLCDEILGLGALEEFMRDSEVDEIMVNGPDKIFVEKRGRLILTEKTFSGLDQLKTVIDRILMPAGRMVNERNPFVDARLTDGSRVHAIIPPLSLTGPMLTIRKFSRIPYTMHDLIYKFKSLTPGVGEFLKLCVKHRKNIVVSGSASSGKTTLLNVLSSFINPSERIICIEDSAELRLNLENLGRLEARQQGTEAKNPVTIRDLVKNSLRMRPDRIIVGECRGAEALDMLQAMNTGHDGSLTTLHANSPRDALARLETMVLIAGVELPLRAVREQIASAVDVIVQTSRFADGTRRIQEIVEVTGIDETTIKTQSIFKFENKWINEAGQVFGDVYPTGNIPEFLKDIPGNLEEETAHLFSTDKTPPLEESQNAS